MNTQSQVDNIVVGLNIGSIDMPHLALVLPRFYALFSNGTNEFNALCRALDGATYLKVPNPLSRATWKLLGKAHADSVMATLREGKSEIAAHDAESKALILL